MAGYGLSISFRRLNMEIDNWPAISNLTLKLSSVCMKHTIVCSLKLTRMTQLVAAATILAAGAMVHGEMLYYNDWAQANIPEEIRLVAGGPEQDADGDKLANGYEFLWGTDPMVMDLDVGSSASLQTGGDLQVSYQMPLSLEGRTGIWIDISQSEDLVNWSAADTLNSYWDWHTQWVHLGQTKARFFRQRLVVADLDDPASITAFRLEAEDQSWSNAAVETEWTGYSGEGYVNTPNSSGEWVEFAISLEMAGTHQVGLRYALGGSSDRPHSISLNGAVVGTFTPSPMEWTDWRTETLELSFLEGINLLRITGTGSGGVANIDCLDVMASPGAVYYQLSANAVGPGTVAYLPESMDGTYLKGTKVSITALPDSEEILFKGWSGDFVSSDTTLRVIMEGNTSIQATFAQDIGTYEPDFGLYGWATQNGGTTGGEGGTTVTPANYTELVTALSSDLPMIIRIEGTITGTGDAIRVHSNKSILGVGSDARLMNLGLQIGWNSEFGNIGNVIVRNIYFGEVPAPTDKIAVTYGGHNVWVDHCVFESPPTSNVDTYDGQIDITHAGDFVTVSWCRFIQHNKNILIGHSENNGSEDTGHLRATFHHNEFRNTKSRNPSVRFGTVHCFNNFYNTISDYGIASRLNAQVVVENNYFFNVLQPMNADTGLSDVPGFIRGVDTNIFVGCGPNSIITEPATWIPPYPYTLDDAASIPAIVQEYAGTGVVTF